MDTAEVYQTERQVADDIEGIRDRVFLATKISAANLHYDDVLQHAAASLERLRTDVIDLYQIHSPSSEIPISETMRAMNALVADGRVRLVGVSNFSVDQMKEAQDALGDTPLVSNQVLYNLFARDIEADVLPYCQSHEITVIAYTPLDRGQFDERRVTGLAQIAAETGRTWAQLLLNWVVAHDGVMAIPKTDRVERVDEAVSAVGWSLTPAQRTALEALS